MEGRQHHEAGAEPGFKYMDWVACRLMCRPIHPRRAVTRFRLV